MPVQRVARLRTGRFHLGIVAFLLIGLTLLAACSPLDLVRTPFGQIYSEEEIAAFRNTTLQPFESNIMRSGDGVIPRELCVRLWKYEEDVVIRVEAGVPGEARLVIDYVVDEYSELIDELVVRFATAEEERANLRIEFQPESAIEGLGLPDWWRERSWGAEVRELGDGKKDAVVIISTDISPVLEAHVIREAISGVLGLGHNLRTDRDNFFYGGSMANTVFTELDRAVIQMMYDPRIHNRMSSEDLDGLGLRDPEERVRDEDLDMLEEWIWGDEDC